MVVSSESARRLQRRSAHEDQTAGERKRIGDMVRSEPQRRGQAVDQERHADERAAAIGVCEAEKDGRHHEIFFGDLVGADDRLLTDTQKASALVSSIIIAVAATATRRGRARCGRECW